MRPGRIRSRTPVWRERGEGGHRVAVPVPKSWAKHSVELEPRHEREDHQEEGGAPSELERELEKEMMLFLREQNSRLMMRLHAVTKGKGSSAGSSQSWEHVESVQQSHQVEEVQPPPPPSPYASVYTPMSPSRVQGRLDVESVRYTPNGTRVPEGAPPVEDGDEVHVNLDWPRSLGGPGAFEPVSQGQLQELRRMGKAGWDDRDLQGRLGVSEQRMAWELDAAQLGRQEGNGDGYRGRSERLYPADQERHRAYQHGGEPEGHRVSYQYPGDQERHRAYEHGGVFGGHQAPPPPPGHWDGRRAPWHGGEPERQQDVERPCTPREARLKWLQREMNALQAMLEEKHGKPSGSRAGYWDTPFETQDQRMRKLLQQGGQRGSGTSEEKVEDCLRSFPITLPRLVEPNVQNAAL